MGLNLANFRERLLQQQGELESVMRSMEETGLNMPLQESISELSSYDNHPADLGSEVFERSKDMALHENAEIRLHAVQEALQRITAGTYGLCERCGDPIDPARLEAVPETSVCKHCRQELEGSGDRHPRPIEEDVINPPFGGFTNDRDYRELNDLVDQEVMYDGEDAWQDLARTTEHAEDSSAGSYYGGNDLEDDRGAVVDIDSIPVYRGADGVLYEDLSGPDEEHDGPDGLIPGRVARQQLQR